MWTGTQSLWIKVDPFAAEDYPQFFTYRSGSNVNGANFGGYGQLSTGDIQFYTKINGNNSANFETNFTNNDWNDGGWHLLTWAYNVSTGATGTGSASVWIDGQAQIVSYPRNGISTDDVFTPYEAASIGTDLNPSLSREYDMVGNIDDVATFDVQLTAAQANALYQVGTQKNLNAKDAQTLFDLYVSGGTAVVGGQTWEKYGTGTTFNGTGALASDQLALGTTGGVQIQSAAVDVTWTGGTNTTWTPGTGNWKATSGGAAATYGDGVNVTFDDSATGTTTANINAAILPATVTFNNTSKNFTVTGTGVGIGGTATVLKQGTGTVTMSSANSYTGLTTQENGKLVLAGGAKTPVLSNAGINLKFGKLVLDYNDSGTSPAAIDTAMKASYAGGAWTGNKFQSTTATTANTLGWKADTINKLITVEYTLYGDANVDGSVNLSDLGFLGDNYGATSGATWAMGDFNYDGKVNLSDLGFLGDQYGGHVAGFVTAGPVGTAAPEPGTLVLLAAASVGLGFYGARRRKSFKPLLNKLEVANMRKAFLLMCVCAVVLAAVPAQAAFIGTWQSEDAGSGLTRYLLNITGDQNIKGLDISITSSTPYVNNGIAFHAPSDANTDFLFNKSHFVPPSSNVTDLLVNSEFVGVVAPTSYLLSSFTATANGAYASGWDTTGAGVNVAEIITDGAVADPYAAFTVALTTDAGAPAQVLLMNNDLGNVQMAPEPGTLVLLLSGAIGLLVFAWRRRK